MPPATSFDPVKSQIYRCPCPTRCHTSAQHFAAWQPGALRAEPTHQRQLQTCGLAGLRPTAPAAAPAAPAPAATLTPTLAVSFAPAPTAATPATSASACGNDPVDP